jgi:hypothetical protein
MDLQQIKQRLGKIPWRKIGVVAFLVVCVAGAQLAAYRLTHPAPKPSTGPQIASPAPQAANVPQVVIPGPKVITVYVKQKLAEKVPLPPEVANNPQVQATATAAIIPSPYGGTAVSYTNMTTGVSGISYQPKARPWYEFGGQTAIGAGAGVSFMGGQTGAVRIRQDVLRLWGVNLAAEGEANMRATGQAEGRAMVWAEWRR